jgi:hypothetical protein
LDDGPGVDPVADRHALKLAAGDHALDFLRAIGLAEGQRADQLVAFDADVRDGAEHGGRVILVVRVEQRHHSGRRPRQVDRVGADFQLFDEIVALHLRRRRQNGVDRARVRVVAVGREAHQPLPLEPGHRLPAFVGIAAASRVSMVVASSPIAAARAKRGFIISLLLVGSRAGFEDR